MTRTLILLAGLTAIFALIGFLVGGEGGMIIALLIAAGMNLFAYWNSDRAVLAMYGARPASITESPDLFNMVRRLAKRAKLPMPKIYIIDDDQPNAFATGRDPEHAAVAATRGLLRTLPREEIAGVMAHELAHIRNRDTLMMTITATLAGAISLLANFAFFFGGSSRDSRETSLGPVAMIAMAILAPVAAMLVQMAISRAREYEADKTGARIAGNPLWLASALRRLERDGRKIPNAQAEANPASAHLFIINPLRGEGMAALFATHPQTHERIRRLHAMAQRQAKPAPAPRQQAQSSSMHGRSRIPSSRSPTS